MRQTLAFGPHIRARPSRCLAMRRALLQHLSTRYSTSLQGQKPGRRRLRPEEIIFLNNKRIENKFHLHSVQKTKEAESIEPALLDPNLCSETMHHQFRELIRVATENRTLAAQGTLRPFDDSMEGIAAVLYLQDIWYLRLHNYRRSAAQGASAVALAWQIMLERGRQRGVDGLPMRMGAVKQRVAETAEYMKDISVVMHSNNFFIGRNMLYAQHRIATERWKRNFYTVIDVWQDMLSYTRGVSWLRLFPTTFIEKLRCIATRALKNMQVAKGIAKGLRSNMKRRSQPAHYELDCAMEVTHPFYDINSSVLNAMTGLQAVYFRAASRGVDRIRSFERFHVSATRHRKSSTSKDVQTLIQVYHFLRATRITHEHSYQKWPSTAPPPVVPSFVAEAIEQHRLRYSSSSIF